MSHLKIREENNCLNCGAVLHNGNFCHVCGQENTEPRENFWHLLTHFVYDVTHFDGKFFSTLKYLILRPGFLSKEYMRGRRNSYLNPIRMYVFTSAFFFLVIFSLNKHNEQKEHIPSEKSALDKAIDSLTIRKEQLNESVKLARTDSAKEHFEKELDKLNTSIKVLKLTNEIAPAVQLDNDDDDAKDSIVQKHPTEKHKSNNELHISGTDKNSQDAVNQFIEFIRKKGEGFQHKIPQIMFVTLPLMALVLQLLYIRMKKYYYVDHVIFILHLYVALYILILIILGLGALQEHWPNQFTSFLGNFTTFGFFFYIYKSLRNFYGQGRVKTIFKLFLLNTFFFIIAVTVSGIFLFSNYGSSAH